MALLLDLEQGAPIRGVGPRVGDIDGFAGLGQVGAEGGACRLFLGLVLRVLALQFLQAGNRAGMGATFGFELVASLRVGRDSGRILQKMN